MNNTITYKKYTGSVNYDPDDRIFFGRVLGINDIISYEGKSVDELENDFQGAVNDYIKLCKSTNKKPEKPYSGKFNVRIPSDLHSIIAQKAKSRNISLNKWAIEAFEKAAD